MQLSRLPYDASVLVDFYEEGLTALGALCERTWHDRLEIVAEGQAAKLWNAEGALHEIELTFAPADVTAARDAAREVFPGCPLTFRLAEALRPAPLPLERVLLVSDLHNRAPDATVGEKLWRAQFPDTTRWRMTAPFKSEPHFSLVALARCEIQAIAQHWSLHRLAVAWPGGESDEPLARELSFAQANPEAAGDVPWPAPAPGRVREFLQTALELALAEELGAIRVRQESYLRRELERIDEYFANYELELSTRAERSHSENTKLKVAGRLAAARAEHTRRRVDQVARHEIRVHPHWDALLLVAEPAWRASLQVERGRVPQTVEARFVPRARQWFAVA